MNISPTQSKTAYFHLPGLFEAFEFYRVFLPLYREHREYFLGGCEIGSVYGAPRGALWGGGRVSDGEADAKEVLALMDEFGISARLTFSNSLLRKEHLDDKKCNALCAAFEHSGRVQNGIIVHSDLLLDYLLTRYPGFYFVSSTTKVLTDFEDFLRETDREEFRYVVPDFRLNKSFDRLHTMSQTQKDKTEFLLNECCDAGCTARKTCYESVSRILLGEDAEEFKCASKASAEGYRFSRAMQNPCFIANREVFETYLPMGFSNFKVEGRGLGSALLLEFLLYYMTKPEYQLNVREALYLDSSLDLF